MAFDIHSEELTVRTACLASQCQALVEGALLLPNVARSASVLFSDGAASIASAEAGDGFVAVQGTVSFSVLYVADALTLGSAQAQFAFDHRAPLEGAHAGMEVRAEAVLEEISLTLTGARANARAVMALDVRAEEYGALRVISDASGDGLCTQKMKTEVCQRSAAGTERMLLDGKSELPRQMRSAGVAMCRHRLRVISATAAEDAVEVRGELHLALTNFTGSGGGWLGFSEHRFPFEMSVPAQGCSRGDTAWAELELSQLDVHLVSDSDDDDGAPQTFTFEGLLSARAQAERVSNVSWVDDMYATGARGAEPVKRTCSIKRGALYDTCEASVRLSLPADIPPGRTVLGCFVRPVSHVVTGGEQAAVSGIAEAAVVFVAPEGGAPQAARMEVPFEFQAELRGGLPDMARIRLEVLSAEMYGAGDSTDVRARFRLEVSGEQTETLELPVDIREVENVLPEKSAISVIAAREGDTLWAVAKRNLTTVEALRRYNPGIAESGGKLSAGERLVALRRGRG